MARIRSIHPGIWTDEAFVSTTRDARLLFIGLLNECDDFGAFEWKPLQIKMKLCPGDDVATATVSTWMEELITTQLIKRYEINGVSYGAVRNFRQWQRPKKPHRTHPMTDEIAHFTGMKRPEFRTGPEPDEPDDGDIPPPVPHQSDHSGEKPPQREETLGIMEEEIGRGGVGVCNPRVRANGAAAPPAAPPPKALSRGWLPDPRALAYADQALGAEDAERELEKFAHHYAERPAKRRSDWNFEFTNWIDREIKFRQQDGGARQ